MDTNEIRGISYMPTQLHGDIKKLMKEKGVGFRVLGLAVSVPQTTLMQNINGASSMPVDRYDTVITYLQNYKKGN